MEQDRMTRLVVCSNLLLFLRDDTALLLCADANLNKCAVDIALADKAAVFLCRKNGGLIHKVFQISSGKAGGCLCHTGQVYVFSKRFFLGMNLKDLHAALHIRTAYCNLTVKTSRTQNSRI